MADPIMDLLDDTPLFSLDSLPEAFTQGSSDPVEEALKLALGQVDTPPIPAPAPVQQPAQVALAPAVPVSAQSVAQTAVPVGSSSGAATVLLGSPLAVPVSTATPQQVTAGQAAPKIVILKGPQGQVLQGVAAGGVTGSPTGKVTIARVLTGTPLRPGMSIVSGGAVLNATPPAQGQVKVGTGVQRLVQSPNGPLKQVLLTSVPQTQLQTQTQVQLQTQPQTQVQLQTQPQVQLQTQPQTQVQLQTQPQVQTQVQLQTQPQVQTQVQLQPQTQVQLQTQTQATAAVSNATVRPQGVTLTTVPQQGGEAKRITLVLQQPAQAGAGQGGTVTVGGAGGGAGQQPRLVLGSLPGKLVLQGGQLAALTQARAGQPGAGQPGAGQPKVLTIQLQVQQQPNAQGAKFQLVSGAPSAGSPQVVQISQGQGGQRLAVPLKLLLQQPQAGSTSTAGGTVSVVKVINTSAAGSSTITTSAAGGSSAVPRSPKGAEPLRRVETLCKQEKANRIVAEAIARAKARGERNIPRVLNLDELPAGTTPGLASVELGPASTSTTPGKKKTGGGGAKKKSPSSTGGKGGAGGEKKGKAKLTGGVTAGGVAAGGGAGGSKSKSKTKANTITPVGGKKRKRTGSSDHSDGELSPPASPHALEEDMMQKRRSNRQVKRKKYTEDLDIKITDDEDEQEEEVDVTTTAGVMGQEQLMGEQLQELSADGDGLPSMQFFVENPSEEDAAIVDKVLAMRVTKKEVSPGQYVNVEEFFVKYKNYSYMHCEWASMEQLERDKRIHQKLKRFKTKQAQMRNLFQEEEGLKLTFSKQALLPNGSGGEGSSRRKRKELEQLCDPDGPAAVRRRDLPDWLKDEADGDMLELLANSRGQRKRRRRKKTEKAKEAAALTGSERVKLVDMRTGRKFGGVLGPALQDLRECLEENPDYAVAPEWADAVRNSGFLPETLFHRLLSPKRGRLCPAPPQAQLQDPLLGGGGGETLVSDGAYMMEDEDLDDGGIASSHHFLTPAFDVKMEAGALQMDGGHSLSHGGYESSDREVAILDDVIMAPKNSDSSSSSED
ncbi:chromodomain-helicase-DNA-binding protein 8-like [Megalops cyprinoides]|uniref:chromodomain-helicase-DNA-binding protein 8-like n=1 Tax=Megalops cyprinoides TaxID=118141 RepID=UPI001863E706|nr:chromodomain-helicase-DNA-binding protein 8-like [Megalops cyprinoides]